MKVLKAYAENLKSESMETYDDTKNSVLNVWNLVVQIVYLVLQLVPYVKNFVSFLKNLKR